MHEVVNFLKDAVQRGQGAGTAGCYVVRDGAIYARNMALQAGLPWPDQSRFTLPADALDAALSRMKEIDSITIEDDNVVLRSKRLRSTIKRIHEEPAPMPDFPPDEEWTPSPPGLARALQIASMFVGDRTWQVAVRLSAGAATAFGPQAGVMIEVPGLDVPRPFLLPKETAIYIASQGDPDELTVETNTAIFRWEDGRWIRTTFINDEMPDGIIRKILDEAGDEAKIQINDDWREALADASALSDDTVQLSASGFTAIKENVRSDVDLEVDVGTDHLSKWRAKRLADVFQVATSWNPEAYPQPALFLGEGLRGVVAGFQ